MVREIWHPVIWIITLVLEVPMILMAISLGMVPLVEVVSEVSLLLETLVLPRTEITLVLITLVHSRLVLIPVLQIVVKTW